MPSVRQFMATFLVAVTGATATFLWFTNGPGVNYDTHGDGSGINYHRYVNGTNVDRLEGELTAAFTRNHGWFRRNRLNQDVTITLQTSGDYSEISSSSEISPGVRRAASL